MAKRSKADWTAEDLARQAEAAAALVDYLREVDEDDHDLVQDSIEGETDFLEVIDRALEQIAEAEMMADALSGRIAALKARKSRFEGRAGFLRSVIQMAMVQANGDQGVRPLPFTLQTPSATVTVRDGKERGQIVDEALLPAEFWKTAAPTVDRAKINEAVSRYLDARRGEQADVVDDETGDTPAPELPPGVELAEPGFSLTIRRN